MKLSGYKSDEVQGLLWDEPLRGMGHARTVVGELGEELTAQALGGVRHRTDSRADYCPDVSWNCPDVPGFTEYAESKVVGKSGTGFVYSGRLLRDEAFAAERVLYYSIWHHRAKVGDCSTVQEVRRRVMAGLRAWWLVPFAELNRLLFWREHKPLNSKYGGTDRQTYGSGVRFPVKLLDPWRVRTFPHGITKVEEVRP